MMEMVNGEYRERKEEGAAWRSWLAEELSLFSEITIKVIILITIPNEGRR